MRPVSAIPQQLFAGMPLHSIPALSSYLTLIGGPVLSLAWIWRSGMHGVAEGWRRN